MHTDIKMKRECSRPGCDRCSPHSGSGEVAVVTREGREHIYEHSLLLLKETVHKQFAN
jgi:hypothetical protein